MILMKKTLMKKNILNTMSFDIHFTNLNIGNK